MTANFAGSFAPYTPPPDDPSRFLHKSLSRSTQSYQSGGLPLSTVTSPATSADVDRGQHNEWETTYGLRVEVLAALAYLLGPISALALLVLETRNDYVRFHAYQAALLMTPLLVTYIFATVLQFPTWVSSFLALLLCMSGLSMATRAFLGASGGRLSRYRLPRLGILADQWVDEE